MMTRTPPPPRRWVTREEIAEVWESVRDKRIVEFLNNGRTIEDEQPWRMAHLNACTLRDAQWLEDRAGRIAIEQEMLNQDPEGFDAYSWGDNVTPLAIRRALARQGEEG